MVNKTQTITLAEAPIEVPFFPIRLNKIAYPICRKLHNAGLLERIIQGKGQLDCSASEMEDLTELAFLAASAAQPRLTREEFENWPISPPELVDAFYLIRYQTGGWIAPEPSEAQGTPAGDDGDELGEAPGMEKPPT